MKKLLIEDVQVGISTGGMACGLVPGHVVVEARIRDLETGTVTYHSLAEVGGMPNFVETDVSTFDTQIEENYDDEEAWDIVSTGQTGGYGDYSELYADFEAHEDCDEDHALIWKYLAYMARADWDETNRMKTESVGKCLGDYEIPVCDAEREYLDEQEEDDGEGDPSASLREEDMIDTIRQEYVGLRADRDHFNLDDDDTLCGDYDFEDVIRDDNGIEYKVRGGYSLDDQGEITWISRMTWQRLSPDGADEDVGSIAEKAYEFLRDLLDGLL